MDPERWRQIQPLYLAALKLAPHRREAFLNQVCGGDESLRKELDWLLTHHEEAGRFLVSPAIDVLAQDLALDGAKDPSPAMIGRSLAHYRIEEKLGGGGMGIVYQAYDTHLRRSVAIKMLRPEVMGDPQQKKRLLEEARAASALNHPNIVTIYDIINEGGSDFIAMELVGGKTLAKRISEGRLPTVETMKFAIQIVSAVARAHRAGIIHRDLKPANIMINEEGMVKVLDFGLAKLTHLESGASDQSTLTTIPRSETGTIAGTPAYMSPEQALGRPVDARSDIFSIGVILFQCLTGQLPFAHEAGGASPLNWLWEQPLPLRSLVPDAPEALERIVQRCLEKDPAARHESADILAEELQHALEPGPGLLHRWLQVAAVVVICISLPALLWISRSCKPAKNQNSPISATLEQVITWESDESNSRISPDRKFISFISNRSGQNEIWLKNMVGGEPTSILSSHQGIVLSHAWSPDGTEIAYLIRDQGRVLLQTVPAFMGGAPQLTQEVDGSCLRIIRWIGDHIYMEGGVSLFQYDVKAQTLRSMISFRRPELKSMRHFDVRRDEARIAFTAYDGQENLWTADLDGKNPLRLTTGDAVDRHPLWVQVKGPDIVCESNRGGQLNLFMVSTQDRSIRQITSGAMEELPEDISNDGSLLTFTVTRDSAHLYSLDLKTGSPHQLTNDSLDDLWPTCDNDAHMVAFQRKPPKEHGGYPLLESQILLGSLSPSGIASPSILVRYGYSPALSPNGRWLAYLKWVTADNQFSELWVIDPNGQGLHRISARCPTLGVSVFPYDFLSTNFAWSANSRYLYFIDRASSGTYQIRRFDPGTPETEPAMIVSAATGQVMRELRLSKDRRYLSYVLQKGANLETSEVHVRVVDSREDRTVYSVQHKPSGLFLFSCGFLASGDSMIVLPAVINTDGTQNMQIIEVPTSGASRPLNTAEGAFGATAKLDPSSQTLYLTMAKKNIHNLWSFSIPNAKFNQLTDNRWPSVSFSDIEILSDGRLLYSRLDQHGDISICRFERRNKTDSPYAKEE